jgi:aerobic-type carbon monoxide dehydrogenase small subunit (CoxS/CutS family)
MSAQVAVTVNGARHKVTASIDTPLLYVLHNELHLHSPRFGCGVAQCGACSVLLDGKEIRSCVTPVGAVSGKRITTLEGLPARWANERGATAGVPKLHPLQQAWVDHQVPHCGYCQSGMMIQAADLLSTQKHPTADQIRTAMNGHLCRCGTYPRITRAIQAAGASMTKGGTT